MNKLFEISFNYKTHFMSRSLLILFAWLCLVSSCKCGNNESASGVRNDTATVISADNSANSTDSANAVTKNTDASNGNTSGNGTPSLYRNGGHTRAKYSGKTPGEFPEGSDKKLTEEDVMYLSEWGLKVMQNEIYARHGQSFANDPQLDAHFRKVGWYHGGNNNVSKRLTRLEKENIAFLKSYVYKPGINK